MSATPRRLRVPDRLEFEHTKWEKFQHDRWTYAKCPYCGITENYPTYYCPQCGTDMRKEDEKK
jgi:uncharacterized OB-fold protein